MPLHQGFLDELRGIVGTDALVLTTEGRMTYECDMHTFYKGAPDAVVLPARAEQVQAVVRLCRRAKVPIVPR
jgi:FAD/FMN-containing dehydrogenase